LPYYARRRWLEIIQGVRIEVTQSTEIFLDTSIHMAKHKGESFEKKIGDHLKKFKWLGTSSYTITEFGNNILKEVEYYLRCLQRFGSVKDMISHIANALPYHLKKKQWGLNLLLKYYGDDAETAIASFETFMKYHKKRPAIKCDDLVDGTGCYFAKNGVTQQKDGSLVWDRPKCRKNKRRCTIDDFFAEHKEQFILLAKHIEALPEEERTQQLEDFAKVIRLAESNPSELLSYNNCKRLADALIAMDALSYKSFFTQNIKESKTLCNFFGQSLYYMSNKLDDDVKFIPPNHKEKGGNGESVAESEASYKKSKAPGK